MNSLWLVVTALAAFLVAYRFYGAFLAAKVAVLNDRSVTPAHRLRDDVDYQPTRRLVLFGVHFAAIAGPGPLVGPVLGAMLFSYLQIKLLASPTLRDSYLFIYGGLLIVVMLFEPKGIVGLWERLIGARPWRRGPVVGQARRAS